MRDVSKAYYRPNSGADLKYAFAIFAITVAYNQITYVYYIIRHESSYVSAFRVLLEHRLLYVLNEALFRYAHT